MASQYYLGDTNLAGARLNFQQAVGLNIFDGRLLEPPVAASLADKTDIWIADVCCGTGTWLLQVAQQYGNATLNGFDINLAETPNEKWLPANVNFRQFDVFADLEEDMKETYDVVSIQIVHVFLRDSNVGDILQKLIGMLKPGGWLQWTDQDVLNHEAIMPLGETLPEISAGIVHELYKLMSFEPNRWTSPGNCEPIFREAGLADVQYRRPDLPLSALGPCMQSALWSVEEVCTTVLRRGAATRERTDEDMQRVQQAWKDHRESGAVLDLKFFRCIGRKP